MYRSTVVILIVTLSAEALIITTEQGTLNGTQLEARNGRKFNAFFRIPFAQPPIGNLRFKAPVEFKSWSGVWDASFVSPGCIQKKSGENRSIGSEDCLYLNVYTPLNTQKGDNLSVIAYIFGGIFKSGSNWNVGPEYIMGGNVILVIPNYRLGVLGFLSTGDTVIPGNFGLKDQLLALKWIQKNIYNFGGDPNKVTLFGHSSGAVCVHLHSLSPRSKGLFQQVIIQSGTAFCSLAYFGPDVTRSVTKEFATKAGCPHTKSSEKMLHCFMNMNSSVMPLIQEEMYVWASLPDAPFRPTIEDKSVPDAFLTEIPNNMHYHSPDLPWIIGMTTGESAGSVAGYLGNGGVLAEEIDRNYKLLFPISMQYLWNTKRKHLDYTSRAIRTHYFDDEEIGAATSGEMVDMFTAGTFGICTVDAIVSYPGLKYVYWFDYVSNYSEQTGLYDEFLGVSHADDLRLFYRKASADAVFTHQDVMFSEELVKRYLNFVNTGNPNIPVKINETMMGVWEPAKTNRIEYLLINLNGTMHTDFYKETYEFWKLLPIGSKYYNNREFLNRRLNL